MSTLERSQQAVDDGPVQTQCLGSGIDRHGTIGCSDEVETRQAAVERLRECYIVVRLSNHSFDYRTPREQE